MDDDEQPMLQESVEEFMSSMDAGEITFPSRSATAPVGKDTRPKKLWGVVREKAGGLLSPKRKQQKKQQRQEEDQEQEQEVEEHRQQHHVEAGILSEERGPTEAAALHEGQVLLDGGFLSPVSLLYMGVFLNGVGAELAGYSPLQKRSKAKNVVREHVLASTNPLTAGSKYIVRVGSTLVIFFLVDSRNRVYSCLAAADYPRPLAFAMLEELQVAGRKEICVSLLSRYEELGRSMMLSNEKLERVCNVSHQDATIIEQDYTSEPSFAILKEIKLAEEEVTGGKAGQQRHQHHPVARLEQTKSHGTSVLFWVSGLCSAIVLVLLALALGFK